MHPGQGLWAHGASRVVAAQRWQFGSNCYRYRNVNAYSQASRRTLSLRGSDLDLRGFMTLSGWLRDGMRVENAFQYAKASLAISVTAASSSTSGPSMTIIMRRSASPSLNNNNCDHNFVLNDLITALEQCCDIGAC